MSTDSAFVLWFTLAASGVTIVVVAVTAAVFLLVRRRSIGKE